MARLHPEDFATERHEVVGPLLAGGVNLIGERTGLFSDYFFRHALADERRFRAHLDFRERAFQVAVPGLVSAAKSPVDLFRLLEWDRDQFLRSHGRHDRTSSEDIINDDGDDGSIRIGAAWIARYLPDDPMFKNAWECLYQTLCRAQRHSAYRKLLVKLDFIQPDSDPEDVLQKLKSSTRWSELGSDYRLRRCLESHMNFLKEYEKSKTDSASNISEYENAALENINSERSSELERQLHCSDWGLMEQYYDRVKLKRLARECATQAQTIGVILVREALPVPVNSEVRTMTFAKRIESKFRVGDARLRSWQLLALGTLATVATAVGFNGKLGMDSEGRHS